MHKQIMNYLLNKYRPHRYLKMLSPKVSLFGSMLDQFGSS